MSEIFLAILNRSLTASYVILFVTFIRLLLKKAPKGISYALWSVVAFRLIIPFSFESIFSLLPRNINTTTIPQDIVYQQNPQINSGIKYVNIFINEMLPAPTIGASVNPLQIYIEIGAYIWALGMMALLVYSLVSILLLRRQLKNIRLISHNIYEVENLKTPFVLGIVRPKIYLPVGISVEDRRYILLHEHTHIHRCDHIIKPLAFLILSIHWFNPLVWIAFILMSMDMEFSCDECVLKALDIGIKKSYASSLLSLATERHILNGSHLAFGEENVKWRIKNVLNYKKPKFWVVFISVIIAVIACLGLISNPHPTSLSKANAENVNVVQIEVPNKSEALPEFSETEISAAVSVVKEYFRAVAAKDDAAILKTLTLIHHHPNKVLYGDERRTLLSIDYNKNDSMRRSYLENGRGSINGTKIENVIVFKVTFNVKYPKSVTGPFNEGDYNNWSMILIRDDNKSPWLIDDQGY